MEVKSEQIFWRDVRDILDKYPTLNDHGFCLPASYGDMNTKEGRKERKEQLRLERSRLLSPDKIPEYDRALRFLHFIPKRKTINYDRSSYGLKHAVEEFARREIRDMNSYLTNGVFIVAAIFSGFEVEAPLNRLCPINVFFNISSKGFDPFTGSLRRAYTCRFRGECLSSSQGRYIKDVPTCNLCDRYELEQPVVALRSQS